MHPRIETSLKVLEELRYRKYNMEEAFMQDEKAQEREMSRDEQDLEKSALQTLNGFIMGDITFEKVPKEELEVGKPEPPEDKPPEKLVPCAQS